MENFSYLLITTKSGPVISRLENHFAVFCTCRGAGPAYSRPHRINHAHSIFQEDAGQFMPHHRYFIWAYSIYTFKDLINPVGNLFLFLIREILLYMISDKQSLRGCHHWQIITAVMAPRLAVQGFRQGLKGCKFLNCFVSPT